MNTKARRFTKKFSYTITSNLVSLIVSALVILIVPKLIGVKEYGYWQIYIFYSAYVGFLHFGWSDGVYLRFGGEKYENLDKRLFSSQFYFLIISQLLIAVIISISAVLIFKDENKTFIFFMVSINLIIVNVLSFLLLTLQATNRIIEYAYINLVSRLFYIVLILIFLLLGIREYKVMIIADLIGKLLSLLYGIIACREIVFQKFKILYSNFTEVIINIRVGSKLMFANVASMLVIGIVRFGIERTWGVSTFGKVSLTLSISNLLMLFINALGIVIFPILKRIDNKLHSEIYSTIRDFLMLFLFGVIILYFPLKEVLAHWLPNYSESLKYMLLLFPVSLYEGKMGLLINTYLKTLRKEKYILRINVIIMILSVVITLFTTIIFESLTLTIISILFLIALRSIVAEIYLSNILKINVSMDIFLEVVLTVLFLLIGSFTESYLGISFYIICYFLYLFVKRKQIKISYVRLKSILNTSV